MDPWPLVLAGPLVRRVEPTLVSVWIAVSEACEVELQLWQGEQTTTAAPGQRFATDATPVATAKDDTIRIGERLHLALVTAAIDAATPLQAGLLYSYNVVLKQQGDGTTTDLHALRLLTDDLEGTPPHRALGYQANTLPGFVTPPGDLLKLRIAHGSCRKVHGHGEDALAFLDKVVADNRTKPDERPHQLFLTGDQIYADEVPEMLLVVLNQVGQELIGTTTVSDAGDTFVDPIERLMFDQQAVPADLRHFPAARRQRLTENFAGFTSSAASSHLLSFGEYCAMYLMVWSNVLWPAQLPDADAVLGTPDPLDVRGTPNTIGAHTPLKDVEPKVRAGYAAKLKRVEAFRAALPQVRRVLANVPVYMIFDDHEVTDDWYLTRKWRDLVLLKPLGRDVLRNALVAYGLFQGWGNDPKQFESGPNQQFLERARQLFPAGALGPDGPAARAVEQLLALVSDPTQQPDAFVRWYYTVPGPKHHVVVLDTRSWRTSPSLYSPPGLIAPAILEKQIAQTSRPAGMEVTLVVSPVPVLGLPTIEELLQPALNRMLDVKQAVGADRFGAAGKDPEAWSFDPFAFERLLERLHGHGRVVFLSGDVHYTLTAEMSYWKQAAGGDDAGTLQEATRFIQLTASALKNVELEKEPLVRSPAAQFLFERIEAPVARLIWNDNEPTPVQPPAGERLPVVYRRRLKEAPVLVGAHGWPPESRVDRLPDRAWRFRLVHDGRADADRPEAVRPLPLGEDVDLAGKAGVGYVRVQARHQEALRKTNPRVVYFPSNAGLVRFERVTTRTLNPAALEQLQADGDVPEAVRDALRTLRDRAVPDAHFRTTVKAAIGFAHPVALLEKIRGVAQARTDVLAVRHQIHAIHPEVPGQVAVYADHVVSLEPTGEPAPAIEGAVLTASA